MNATRAIPTAILIASMSLVARAMRSPVLTPVVVGRRKPKQVIVESPAQFRLDASAGAMDEEAPSEAADCDDDGRPDHRSHQHCNPSQITSFGQDVNGPPDKLRDEKLGAACHQEGENPAA
jgi:hypothetical protein